MIKYEIINYGPSRSFPTKIGNIPIAKHQRVEIEGKEVASEILRYPLVKVAKIMRDWDHMQIGDIRKMARIRGIKGTFMMKKKDLLEKLNRRLDNGISTC